MLAYIILCLQNSLPSCQQIGEWFNNHSRSATSGTGKHKILDLVKESKPRIVSTYHAYSTMNKDCVGLIIDQEWTKSVLLERQTDEQKAKPVPPVPIQFRNATLKSLLQAEPSSVHADVESWQRSRLAVKLKVGEDIDEETARLNKADQYHQVQQGLGPTIQQILENIEEQTGLMGLFTVVGPQPICGGNIGAIT